MTQSDCDSRRSLIQPIANDGSPTPFQVLKKHLEATNGKVPEYFVVDGSIRNSAQRIIAVTWREMPEYGDTKVKHRTVITFEQWAGYVDGITREQTP